MIDSASTLSSLHFSLRRDCYCFRSNAKSRRQLRVSDRKSRVNSRQTATNGTPAMLTVAYLRVHACMHALDRDSSTLPFALMSIFNLREIACRVLVARNRPRRNVPSSLACAQSPLFPSRRESTSIEVDFMHAQGRTLSTVLRFSTHRRENQTRVFQRRKIPI